MWPFDLLASRAQVAGVAAQVRSTQDGITAALRRLANMEEHMSELRDALTDAEGNLTTSIGAVQSGLSDLATRIAALPPASDITQDDVDALKADGDALAQVAAGLGELAQPASPDPTPDPTPEPQPGDGGDTGGGDPDDAEI